MFQGLDPQWATYGCDVGRLILAAACGAVVGWEREAHEKAAGLRTHILLAIGACLFTLVAVHVQGEDITRLMQGLVTGTGFLAGGVIFREGLSVRGLTTAVGLWVMGAVGLAIGVGEYFLGVLATLVMFIVLTLVRRIERRYVHHPADGGPGPARP
jgi:putative Mg2+ transporter-C (MgtC) family protein